MKKEPEKKKRGFAAMTPEERKEHGSKGGKRAHELGKANKFDSYDGWQAQKKRKRLQKPDPKKFGVF